MANANSSAPKPGEPGWTYTPEGSERSWTFGEVSELVGGNEHIAMFLCTLMDGQEPQACLDMWESAGIIKRAPREDLLARVAGDGEIYVFADSRYANIGYLEGFMPEITHDYIDESKTGYKIIESFRQKDGSLDVLGYRRDAYGNNSYVVGYGYDPAAGSWGHGAYLSSFAAAAEAWDEVIRDASVEDGRSVGVTDEALWKIEYDLVGFVEELPTETRAAIAGQGLFLDELLQDPDPAVRRAVAEKLESGWQLSVLAEDTEADVRLAVAERGFDLNRFADDPDPRIRAFAAAGNISAENLVRLAEDPDPDVRAAAVGNRLYDVALASVSPAEQPSIVLKALKENFPAVLEDLQSGYVVRVGFPGEEDSERFVVDYLNDHSELVVRTGGHIPYDVNGNPIMSMDDVSALVNLELLKIDPDADIPRLRPENMSPMIDRGRGVGEKVAVTKMPVVGQTSRILSENDLQELVHTTGVFAQDKATSHSPADAYGGLSHMMDSAEQAFADKETQRAKPDAKPVPAEQILELKPVPKPKGKPSEKTANTFAGDAHMAAKSADARRTTQSKERNQRGR